MKNSLAVDSDLMSVVEVAKQIEVHPKTVYAWTYRKSPLLVHRVGRRVFISGEDLVTFLDASRPKSLSPASQTELARKDIRSIPALSQRPGCGSATPVVEKQTRLPARTGPGEGIHACPGIAMIACLQLM